MVAPRETRLNEKCFRELNQKRFRELNQNLSRELNQNLSRELKLEYLLELRTLPRESTAFSSRAYSRSDTIRRLRHKQKPQKKTARSWCAYRKHERRQATVAPSVPKAREKESVSLLLDSGNPVYYCLPLSTTVCTC